MKLSRRAALGLLAAAAGGCRKAEGGRVIRLAHSLDEAHTVHKGMVFMAERLARLSGGKLTIRIYPGGQLGSERETLELLQFGSIGMTKVSAAVMEGFAPRYKLFGVPYLFRDRDHQFRVLDGAIGQEILESGVSSRLRGITYYDSGARHFYTTVPVREPRDLRGKKIRVMNSQSSIALVDGLGAAATPLPLGELYTALQQGVVDGAENNLPSFELLRHYEVCKFLVLDGHTTIPDVLVMSTLIHDQLSSVEKEWLDMAARESTDHQRDLWAEAESASLERLQRQGVTIADADRSFTEAGRDVQRTFREQPELLPLIREVEGLK